MKPFYYIPLFSLASIEALGCLNGYQIPVSAPKVPFDPPAVPAVKLDFPRRFTYGLDSGQRKIYEDVIASFKRLPKGSVTLEARVDYAIAEIYLGHYQIAIAELLAVDPRIQSYICASALGTAYELAGDIENAKKWIAEGIRRDPTGHEGSEWLHLAILDAKLALQQDRAWLKKKSVVSMQGTLSDEALLKALEYQLNERLVFVTKSDDIVADLFFQAGSLSQNAWKREYYFSESLRFSTLRKDQIAAFK